MSQARRTHVPRMAQARCTRIARMAAAPCSSSGFQCHIASLFPCVGSVPQALTGLWCGTASRLPPYCLAHFPASVKSFLPYREERAVYFSRSLLSCCLPQRAVLRAGRPGLGMRGRRLGGPSELPRSRRPVPEGAAARPPPCHPPHRALDLSRAAAAQPGGYGRVFEAPRTDGRGGVAALLDDSWAVTARLWHSL